MNATKADNSWLITNSCGRVRAGFRLVGSGFRISCWISWITWVPVFRRTDLTNVFTSRLWPTSTRELATCRRLQTAPKSRGYLAQ